MENSSYPLNQFSEKTFPFSPFPAYYSIAFQQDKYLNCMFLWDFSLSLSLLIRPIKDPEKAFLEILKEISYQKEPKKLIIFDDFMEISLQTCKLLTEYDLSFAIFSKNRNIAKFEKLNCPLSRKNNVISNKSNLYKNSYDHIEILRENLVFCDFVFLVERTSYETRKFYDAEKSCATPVFCEILDSQKSCATPKICDPQAFTLSDKAQLEGRYRKMKTFIEGIEEVPGIIKGFGDEACEKAGLNPSWREHCVKIYENYGVFMEKNRINCSFAYFLENYVF